MSSRLKKKKPNKAKQNPTVAIFIIDKKCSRVVLDQCSQSAKNNLGTGALPTFMQIQFNQPKLKPRLMSNLKKIKRIPDN